jgi:hypothetical protein
MTVDWTLNVGHILTALGLVGGAIDNVLCPTVGWECSTPALKGGTAELAWIVASGMFFSGIANIIKR